MKKVSFLSFLFLAGGLCISAQTFPSGDFNTFETGWNGVGVQPTGWKGSNVNQFSLAKIQEVYEETSGRNGSAVKLVNTAAGMWGIGANAPAYITLGSPWVYANIADVKGSDGGTWGGTAFAFRPDAVKGFIKREIATETTSKEKYCELNPNEVCNILVYLWKGSTTSTLSNVTTSADGITGKNVEVKDLDKAVLGKVEATKSSDFALIAQAQYDVPAVTTKEWQEVVIPLEYSSDEVPEKLNIIISAADYFNRPNIGDNNKLWADDFEFVYYSELKELTYNGESVEIPSNRTINLSDQVYDATKLSYTLTGKGATAERSYNAQTGVLTLTVKGNDWSVNPENQHVYTIKFKPYSGNLSDVMVSDTRLINVTMGQPFPSLNTVSLTNQDGAVSFTMKNFTFAGEVQVGDVTLDNVVLSNNADGSTHVTAYNGALALLGGAIIAEVSVSGDVKAEGGLTANVQITWNGIPIIAEVSPVPFAVSVAGRTLAVTGELSSNLAQLVMVGGSANISAIDLTGATLTGEFSTEDFGAAANCLFLVPEGAEFTGNNVVKDGACANLVLTDGQPFYAPEAFTAAAISYNRTDLEANEIYTFVLPFAVSTEQVNGAVYELAGITDGVISFASVADGKLEANKPYLVRAKGTTLLADGASISGQVEAVTEATVENAAVTGVTHVGAYQTTPVTSGNATSWYGYSQEGKFVKAKTGTISPFRTALRVGGNGQSSFALKLDGTVTGILNLENPNAKVDVYTIGGVCVRKNVPAASALNGLSRGVYIVGGQKVVK